jgi:hypothetical protein
MHMYSFVRMHACTCMPLTRIFKKNTVYSCIVWCVCVQSQSIVVALESLDHCISVEEPDCQTLVIIPGHAQTLHTTHYILHTTHYILHTTHYTLHTTHSCTNACMPTKLSLFPSTHMHIHAQTHSLTLNTVIVASPGSRMSPWRRSEQSMISTEPPEARMSSATTASFSIGLNEHVL